MDIKYRKEGIDNEILEISNARIVYRNFKGEASKFNRAGDRNFSVVIPDRAIADELSSKGWNVKVRINEEDDSEFLYLPVKVKFNNKGPAIYVNSAGSVVRINEARADMIDEIDIVSVDLDIRPYNWEVNGKTGTSAYLQAMNIIQNVDRFGAMYSRNPEPNNNNNEIDFNIEI